MNTIAKKITIMLPMLAAAALALSALACAQATSDPKPAAPALPASSAWSFGVLSDTQWIGTDDGKNPSTSAISIITQINKQFIAKKVKLVVAVGDLVDQAPTVANEDVRATYAQELYNAGIGFYPLRGNHDSSAAVAAEFVNIYPQTQTGVNNQTPTAAFSAQTTDLTAVTPAAKTGSTFTVGSNFSSPTTYNPKLAGLSYSFDFNNTRFVLLDQFTPADSTANLVSGQQSWISTQLSGRAAATTPHAFVFAHKGLITESHVDNLFGAKPGADAAGENAFITSLAANNVHYFIGGHDHMHDRTIVSTTDGTTAKIQELVAVSDSSKFYIPAIPSNDSTYSGATPRQTSISQELNTVGYYIFTVDGNNVTVDFYSAIVNPTLSGTEYLISVSPSPNLVFSKRESFGYSLKGKEFVVNQGASYATVMDSYTSATGATATAAKILGGTNLNTSKDGSVRAQSLTVDTGWTPKSTGLSSDILSLWGMSYTMGDDHSDSFPLSLSYSGTAASTTGGFGLLRINSTGTAWVNAVNENSAGTAKFVNRAWTAADTLGTCGIDTTTTPPTAWAVVNKAGVFAVGPIQ